MRMFIELLAIVVILVGATASLIYADPEFLKCISSFQPGSYCAAKTLIK